MLACVQLWRGLCLQAGRPVFRGLQLRLSRSAPMGFSRRIRPHVDAELLRARSCADERDFAGAYRHLERAHVLGQRSTREHVRVHWRMLRWALSQRRLTEVAGQTFRLAGAALLTAVGLVPAGNTGGGNVSAFRRMPVPGELAQIIAAARGRPPL